MEIHGPNNVNRASRVEANKQAKRADKAEADADIRKTDKVDISSAAKSKAVTEQFRAELAKVPEVRQERIREIKSQIESGKYITEEKIDKAIDKMLPDM